MNQETHLYFQGAKVAGFPFVLTCLRVGMFISIRGGSATYVYVVEDWEYRLSNFDEDSCALVVHVRPG